MVPYWSFIAYLDRDRAQDVSTCYKSWAVLLADAGRGGGEGVKEDWKLHTCIKDIDVEVYEPRCLSSVNTQLVSIHYAAH